MRRFTLFLAILLNALGYVSADQSPASSPLWPLIHKKFLNGEEVVFDPKVRISIPKMSEDSLNFPVYVSWEGKEKAKRMLLLADLNPIIPIVDYYPVMANPSIATHIKIQQATPIRGAIQTEDGKWHVWAEFADASGGGCTTPSLGMTAGNWADHLGEIHAAVWQKEASEVDRVRFQIQHPMDTGLANNIPKFIINEIEIYAAKSDRRLGRMEVFEPVSENPLFSLDFPRQEGYRIEAKDNNGLFVQGTSYYTEGVLSQ